MDLPNELENYDYTVCMGSENRPYRHRARIENLRIKFISTDEFYSVQIPKIPTKSEWKPKVRIVA